MVFAAGLFILATAWQKQRWWLLEDAKRRLRWSSPQKSALEKGRVVETDNQELGRSLVGCGQNLSTQKIVIAAPQELTACPDDQIGEIWVSGESVAQGYWHKAEVTENTFKACLADTGEGPFLRTGDLGFCHNGELFVTGRVKDLIIVRGQNYYPQDIELTIQNSHPALEMNSGAAFAVEIKNAEQIVVVQEVKRSYLRQLNVTEIIWNIRKAVAREHDLQVYAVALLKPTSIPKTSSGKIMRHVCKQSFLNGKLEVIDDWSEDPQNKKKFLELQTDVDLILQKLKQ